MKIKLTTFTENDFDFLLSWVDGASEKELMQWAGPIFTRPLDRKQLIKYLLTAKGEKPNAYIYKALDENDNPIGHVEISNIDYQANHATLSRVMIAPRERGKGYGEKLIKSVIDIAFRKLNISKLKLSVYTFNIPAMRIYEKIGFKEVNFIAKGTKCGNEMLDTRIMVIHATDCIPQGLQNIKSHTKKRGDTFEGNFTK